MGASPIQSNADLNSLYELIHAVQQAHPTFRPAHTMATPLLGSNKTERNQKDDLNTCLNFAIQTKDEATALKIQNFLKNLETTSQPKPTVFIHSTLPNTAPIHIPPELTKMILGSLGINELKALRLVSKFWFKTYTLMDLFERYVIDDTKCPKKGTVWKKMLKKSDPHLTPGTTKTHLLTPFLTIFFGVSTHEQMTQLKGLEIEILKGGLSKKMDTWLSLYPCVMKNFSIGKALKVKFTINLIAKFKEQNKKVQVDQLFVAHTCKFLDQLEFNELTLREINLTPLPVLPGVKKLTVMDLGDRVPSILSIPLIFPDLEYFHLQLDPNRITGVLGFRGVLGAHPLISYDVIDCLFVSLPTLKVMTWVRNWFDLDYHAKAKTDLSERKFTIEMDSTKEGKFISTLTRRSPELTDTKTLEPTVEPIAKRRKL